MSVDYSKRCSVNVGVDGLHYQVIRYGATEKEMGELWTDVADTFVDDMPQYRRRGPGVSYETPTRYFFSERID